MQIQYIIMDFHGVTNAGGLWDLHFQPQRFQGFQLDYYNIQNTMIRGISQIICGGGVMG